MTKGYTPAGPTADGSQHEQVDPNFRFDLVILLHRFSCKCWDSQMFMNSRGLAVVPLQLFFLQMPCVFWLSMTLGWLFSLYLFCNKCCTIGFHFQYFLNFSIHFVGFTAGLSLLILKIALQLWGQTADIDLPDLCTLWESYELSSVELVAPLILMCVMSARTSCLAYEFTISKSLIKDIAHEFDEQGRFHVLDQEVVRGRADTETTAAQPTMKKTSSKGRLSAFDVNVWKVEGAADDTEMDQLVDTGQANAYLHDLQSNVEQINDWISFDADDYQDNTKFLKLPFIDSPDMEVLKNADAYAERWANVWLGDRHPLSLTKLSCLANVPIILVSLISAATPALWMHATHAKEYLTTPLISPKVIAVHSFLCVYFTSFVLLRLGWAVWSCFRRIRCNLLVTLYLSSTTSTRRYIYRLWGAFGLWNVQISNVPMGTADPVIRDLLPTEPSCCQSPLKPLDPTDARSKLKRLVNQTRILAFDESELTADHWWREKGRDPEALDRTETAEQKQAFVESLQHLQFHILDVNRFTCLRACMKPEIYVDRARLELCMLGSSVVTVLSLVVVVFDIFYTGQEGAVSCIGVMCLWAFLLSSVYTVVSLHSAVLMNMSLIDSTVEVLQQWKARIALVRNEAQRAMNRHAAITSSQMRSNLDSKFRSLLEPLDHAIEEIEAEVPLRCIGVAVTPQWRTRAVIAITAAVVGWLSKLAWTFLSTWLPSHVPESSS